MAPHVFFTQTHLFLYHPFFMYSRRPLHAVSTRVCHVLHQFVLGLVRQRFHLLCFCMIRMKDRYFLLTAKSLPQENFLFVVRDSEGSSCFMNLPTLVGLLIVRLPPERAKNRWGLSYMCVVAPKHVRAQTRVCWEPIFFWYSSVKKVCQPWVSFGPLPAIPRLGFVTVRQFRLENI